mmetsp:Transcript_89932/g.232224  ORF Transcript_89932/g.232224 Transcript_89932/m.232224 type:complete len:207 (+) Transcript_89932:733-1353(+)
MRSCSSSLERQPRKATIFTAPTTRRIRQKFVRSSSGDFPALKTYVCTEEAIWLRSSSSSEDSAVAAATCPSSCLSLIMSTTLASRCATEWPAARHLASSCRSRLFSAPRARSACLAASSCLCRYRSSSAGPPGSTRAGAAAAEATGASAPKAGACTADPRDAGAALRRTPAAARCGRTSTAGPRVGATSADAAGACWSAVGGASSL